MLRVSRINITIITNDIKKIQSGLMISDKVIPVTWDIGAEIVPKVSSS